MSYTAIYAAMSDRNMNRFGDRISNANRGCTWIWTNLATRYGVGVLGGDVVPWTNVWQLRDDSRLNDDEYYALMSTFDRVVIGRDMVDVVAGALERFEPGTENLKRQATLIREAFDRGAIAVGWYQHSVGENVWQIAHSCPVTDCDHQDERPYNLDRDTVHWWMERRRVS